MTPRGYDIVVLNVGACREDHVGVHRGIGHELFGDDGEEIVALETATTGITCNAICPGWVLTPLVQKQIDARVTERGMTLEAARASLLGEKQPSGEFVTPEQLGALAVFLCSPGAEQVRGVAWAMDGGWTAQ